MRLCARAERLRDDMARLNAGLAIAPDGQTLRLLDRRGSDGSLTVAIDRFCDAALLLGQATWGWAQTINVEAVSGWRSSSRRATAGVGPRWGRDRRLDVEVVLTLPVAGHRRMVLG